MERAHCPVSKKEKNSMSAKLVVKFPKDVFAPERQTNCVKFFYFGFSVFRVPLQFYNTIWLHHSNRNNKLLFPFFPPKLGVSCSFLDKGH